VIAVVSTVLVLGLLITAIVTSKGWPSVKEAFFDWDDFKASFPEVLKGFWLDIKMFIVIEIAVLILGLIVALARISKPPALFPLTDHGPRPSTCAQTLRAARLLCICAQYPVRVAGNTWHCRQCW